MKYKSVRYNCINNFFIVIYISINSPANEPKTCPECRQLVSLSQIRRVYFNLSLATNNIQEYIDDLQSNLDRVIITHNNQMHLAKTQMEAFRNEYSNKLQEKNLEIQALNDKLMKKSHQDYELQKLIQKNKKYKNELKEV